ncbi:MAG TPA: AAA family ATPase [Pyrinomonadaceae bacterium]|nr:AAA family ATPase [Pyrinomonadaceae bacterium]
MSNECLWQGTKAIKVRPKAFAVLNYLVVRPGQLVTKEDLLKAVWPNTFVTDAVLKVTIRQLREALDDDPRSPRFIETAHRRGYRFIGQIGNGASFANSDSSDTNAAKRLGVVGRDKALMRIEEWLQKMLQGQRQIVFLTGEAGIGKTALVDAFADSIPNDGPIRIGRGQCLEQYGTSEAYMPVLEAIGRLCRQERRVAEVLRTHAPMWLLQLPSLLSPEERELLSREVSGATRERMLREMGEALTVLTAEMPLVLILEDLHWSDYSTLDLISYLATQRQSAHLMLIGTYRSVELIVTRHPLKAVKQELLAKQQCEELPLEYLTREAVSEYLSVRFPDNRFSDGLAGLIHERTEGNPLFMVNAVDYVVGAGLIVPREGQWDLVVDIEDVELGVPDNIRQMIEKQVDHLGEVMQRTLEAASVAGIEFSTPALVAGLNEDPNEVEARCYELARQRHYIQDCGVQELPNGEVVTRYGFVHALYQNVLYERLSPSRRVELHRRIGEGGEEVYGDRTREIAAELAMHFERGRDYGRAVKYLQQAASNAIRRFAYREAVGLARHGIELIAKLPDGPERTAQELCLQLALGVPLVAIEGYASPQVGSVYLRARELYQQLGDSPDVSEVMWGIWTFYTLSAELQTAREVAEEFLGLSARLTYPGLAMRSHLMMEVTLMHQGEFASAMAHHQKASLLYDRDRHKEDSLFYSQNAGVAIPCFGAWTFWFLGLPNQAVECLHDGLSLARELAEPHGLAHSTLFAAILYQLRHEPRKAQEYAEAVITVSSEHGLVMYKAQATIIRGWALLDDRPAEEAIEEMLKGLAEYDATKTGLLHSQFLTLLAEGLARAGKVKEGLRELDKSLQLAYRSGDAAYLAEVHRMKGELLLRQARSADDVLSSEEVARLRVQAEDCFRESIKVAQLQNAKFWQLRSAVSLARLYQSEARLIEVKELVNGIFNEFTEGFETWDLQQAKALLEELA